MQDMLLSPQEGQVRVPPQPSPIVPHSIDRAAQSTESGMEPVPWHWPSAKRTCCADRASATMEQRRIIAVANHPQSGFLSSTASAQRGQCLQRCAGRCTRLLRAALPRAQAMLPQSHRGVSKQPPRSIAPPLHLAECYGVRIYRSSFMSKKCLPGHFHYVARLPDAPSPLSWPRPQRYWRCGPRLLSIAHRSDGPAACKPTSSAISIIIEV